MLAAGLVVVPMVLVLMFPCEVLLEKGWELSIYGCGLRTTRLGMWRDGIDSV